MYLKREQSSKAGSTRDYFPTERKVVSFLYNHAIGFALMTLLRIPGRLQGVGNYPTCMGGTPP